MKTQVKFFGQLAEITGKSNIEFTGIDDIDSLTKKVLNDFPMLKNFKFQVSVNKKLIRGNQKIGSDAEVAFLPPFAGG